MNVKGKITLDTSTSTERMRKDINFRNIIIKNSCRLRQKSNDDCTSRYLKEPESEMRILKRKIKYQRITKNIFNDSNDTKSIDLNSNFMKQNRLKRNFFLDFNFDKDEQNSNAETERVRENISIKNIINKPQIIRVNQNKSISNNNDFIGNIERKDKIIENDNFRKNIKDNNFTNNNIKQFITNLKESENNLNIKRKVNMKRHNSIRKIMSSLYYNSYTTDKKNNNNEEKVLKQKNLNGNKNNNILKDKEKILNYKKIIVKSNNSHFIKGNNNLNTIKLERDLLKLIYISLETINLKIY